jgi:16S rRNA processing protein RimM
LTPSERRVVLATVGGAHGIRGEVRVKSFTEDPMALRNYGPLSTEDGRALEIERIRPAKNVLIAKFTGIDDRNAAESLNGLSLFVERSALPLPEPGEYYHADLVGLAAYEPNGHLFGEVVAVENYGAGDILEIADKERGSSLLIPFTNRTVPDIDIAAGRLTIVPPAEIEIEGEDK